MAIYWSDWTKIMSEFNNLSAYDLINFFAVVFFCVYSLQN